LHFSGVDVSATSRLVSGAAGYRVGMPKPAGVERRWASRPSTVSVVAVFAAAGLAIAACSSSTERAAPTNVVLVGDSLAEQAAPYLAPLLGGKALVPQFFGGTAPCDWLGKDLQINKDSLLVISFTGNAVSPCMSDGAGGHLAGQAIVDKYRVDVTALVGEARDARARVLLVGQPMHADATSTVIVDGINAIYDDLSKSTKDVRFVDAGAAVENRDGTFAHSLPCLPGEAECDPSGNNVVRSDDGLHFCPGSPPPGPCSAYSSGAFRFANAIAGAVNAT